MASNRFPRIVLLALMASAPAHATLGIFEHGNGIKALGMGGVSYALGEETTSLGANPAHLFTLGRRWDVGVDVFSPEARPSFRGHPAGDDDYKSSGRSWYWVPQGGVSVPLSPDWAYGFTLLSAGLGPDYDRSPYERFSNTRRASLFLGSVATVHALAWRPRPEQALGMSVNLGYQTLAVQGLQFADNPALSQRPGNVTNQGVDGSFNAGFSLGWQGRIAPWATGGAGYRSKSWTQRHKEYAGLLPDAGRLELPAVYGAGIAITAPALPDWTLAIDFQRYQNEGEKAFGNSVQKLSDGHLLGSGDGPGFGLDNQDAWKFGLVWRATPALTGRIGYITASQPVQSSETLFSAFGCVALTTHYTVGATWRLGHWETTGAFGYASKQDVKGRDSIPAALGGGEVNLQSEVIIFGLSVGRSFGGT